VNGIADTWSGFVAWCSKYLPLGTWADWVAAGGTIAAFFAAIGIYRSGVRRDRRAQADAFSTAIWVDAFAGRPIPHDLYLHAENSSDSPIWLAYAYVPREDGGEGYRAVQLFHPRISMLPARESITKVMLTEKNGPNMQAGILVHFRDARNKMWLREIVSGRYRSERQRRRLLRQNKLVAAVDAGDRITAWPPTP